MISENKPVCFSKSQSSYLHAFEHFPVDLYVTREEFLFFRYVFRKCDFNYCQWQAQLNQAYHCDCKLVHYCNIVCISGIFFSNKQSFGHFCMLSQWCFTRECQYIIRRRIAHLPSTYGYLQTSNYMKDEVVIQLHSLHEYS